MLLSRWKLMAGVLGVSIGGLAATASQCPKWDKSKGRAPETPVAKAEPKVAPAGPAAPALPPTPEFPPIPAPTVSPAVPAAPQLTPAGATPPALPVPMAEAAKPPVVPLVPDFAPPAPKPDSGSAGVTPLPAASKMPEPKASEPGKSLPPSDVTPMKPGVAPALPGTSPSPPVNNLIPAVGTPIGAAVTPPELPMAKPALPATPPAPAGLPSVDLGPPSGGALRPEKHVAPPAVVGASGVQPGTPLPAPDAPGGSPAVIDLAPNKAPLPPAPVTESKFRIVLRVGEGEPMFEVKTGDNLVLKVVCEKVDIKSPEKGTGMSEVTARGKVRFAGFGAEGACDELKFFAGTGEVSMSGAVKVVVRDKLGRVESELTSTTLKYKIDASSVGGQIKP